MDPHTSDYDLINDLDIGKINLRMFEVDIDINMSGRSERIIPIGSLRIPDKEVTNIGKN